MSSPRRLLLLVLMIAFSFALAPAAGADAAVGELWRQPLPAAAQVVRVNTDCIAVWSETGGDGAVLRAVRYDPSGHPEQPSPATLVAAPAAIDTLIAAPDNEGGLLLVWKSGGVTAVQRFGGDLAAVYPALAVCSDAAVAVRYGSGATALPLAAGADPDGGAYVALILAGGSGEPASLLERVSPGGAGAAADPGSHFAGRVAGLAVGLDGRARVLFRPARGAGLKLQSVRADLSRAWNPGVTLTSGDVVAIGLIAADHAVAAWRRGDQAYALRVTKDGVRAWRRPVTVALPSAPGGSPSDAALCKDGLSGATVSVTAGGTLQVNHFDAAGRSVGPPSGRVIRTGLDDGVIAGVWSDRSGTLSVAVNGSGGGAPAAVLERFSYLGARLPTPAGIAGDTVTGLTGDESGDLQIATSGTAGAAVARVGETGRAISCEPNFAEIVYGQRVHFGGYALDGPVPLAGRPARPSASASGRSRSRRRPTPGGRRLSVHRQRQLG